ESSMRLACSPPRIEALPEDISIETGKVLTVACAFSGEPVPCIEWSRSGKKLPGEEESGRFHIETTEDLTTLIITSVKESDAGVYTLKLSNEHGSDTFVFCLIQHSAFWIKVPYHENFILFECDTEDAPNVNFKWYKSGSEIRQSEKFRILSHLHSTSLDVLSPVMNDSGEYTCRASNQHGSDNCSASLNVTGFGDTRSDCARYCVFINWYLVEIS
uniref:Ig-like domain-containing protein n=1 Tax=Denticeps clupeoides TaxID=299321 RepID=A0AAY4B637_9TELE